MEAILFVEKEVVEVVKIHVAIINIIMELVTKVKILNESPNVIIVRRMAI
jgi:hypothetical protein